MDELVRFLRERLAEDIERARTIGNMLVTSSGAGSNIPAEAAERQARSQVYVAAVRQTLFEETIRPYLGTAGPTGRIAEQQIRLFAAMYAEHRDYRAEWAPEA